MVLIILMTDKNFTEIKMKLIPSTKSGKNVVKSAQTRPGSDFLDSILGIQYDVLDHGFVRVIDYMGNDSSVVQAARVSYGSGTKKTSEDRSLIRYLMRHYHTSTFEMAEIKLHVKLPIFVARQWVRHRTASLNEYSARYSLMEDEFYIPDASHLAIQSSDNKQGRGEILDAKKAEEVRNILLDDARRCYDNYDKMVNEKGDIHLARELARMDLTVNCYTQWYWKVNLHNLMNFLRLRADGHAQYEIRIYAELILEILKGWCPYVYEAFMDYRINACSFSAQQLDFLRSHLKLIDENDKPSNLTLREWREMLQIIKQ